MPLINRTYFVGELSIPGLDKDIVQRDLDALIAKREPELLRDILGYVLYKAFTEGLQVDPVDPKWTNLLLGSEYTDRFGRLQYWKGLVSAPPVMVDAVDSANAVPYVAVLANQSAQAIPVPASMVGQTWRLFKRAIGELRPDEYIVSLDGKTVSPSTPVVVGDTFFFYSNNLTFEPSTEGAKESLIANYVYFYWLRKQATQTTALGEVATSAENSVPASAARKQQRAWNEMCWLIREMSVFLESNKDTYTQWSWKQYYRNDENYKAITAW